MTSSDLEQSIEQLLKSNNIVADKRLIAELIRTSLQLGSESTNTLNLKIASAALTEMSEAFSMFAPTQTKESHYFWICSHDKG